MGAGDHHNHRQVRCQRAVGGGKGHAVGLTGLLSHRREREDVAREGGSVRLVAHAVGDRIAIGVRGPQSELQRFASGHRLGSDIDPFG